MAVLTVGTLAWTRLLGGEKGQQQGAKKRSGQGKVAVIFRAGRNEKIQIIMKRVLASKHFNCVFFYHVIGKAIETSIFNVSNNSFPGARFSKVPIINGPGKLLPFILKIEVSIVFHLTL